MTQRWFASSALVFFTVLATHIFAEEIKFEKYELSGIVGRMFVSDHRVVTMTPLDVLTTGNGLTFEGNIGRRLWSSAPLALTAELPVVFSPDMDVNLRANIVPADYRSFFVAPSLRANLFPATYFSPWVSIGGGFAYFSESSRLEFGGANPGKRGSASGVFQIGAGLDVMVRDRLGVRVEVRDFDSGVPQLNVDIGKTRQPNLFVGGGVFWRF